MSPLPINTADAVILSIILAVVTLIIRGMLKGRIKSCDCSSCAGNCGSCNQACAAPRIKLNDQQLAELRKIDQRAREI